MPSRQVLPLMLCWGGALLLNLTTVLHLIGAEQLRLVRWFAVVMPWLLVLLVPAALLSLLTQRYLMLLALLVPVVYICGCYIHIIRPKPLPIIQKNQLSVMSYNVWSKNQTIDAVANVITTQSPQLLFLQEIKPGQYIKLQYELAERGYTLGFSEYDPKLWLAIISSLPLTKRPSAGTNRVKVQQASLTLNGQQARLFNVHFIRGCWQRRTTEVADFIRAQLYGNQPPTILAGDLNATSGTGLYRAIAATLDNSHELSGSGFGFTYPNLGIWLPEVLRGPAMVRIDHIFHSEHFSSISAATLRQGGGSDHFPVMSTLQLKSEISSAAYD